MNMNKVSTILLNIGCLVAFTIQISLLTYNQVNPTQTVTSTVRKNLSDMDFPVLFKICIKPGFNTTALKEVGYAGEWEYFAGISRYNSSLVGWAGHGEDGRAVSNVTGEKTM